MKNPFRRKSVIKLPKFDEQVTIVFGNTTFIGYLVFIANSTTRWSPTNSNVLELRFEEIPE